MTTETDITYYPAQPPRMKDPRYFPPSESLPGVIGTSDLGVDEIIDPEYPWQILPHDSPGGKKRLK